MKLQLGSYPELYKKYNISFLEEDISFIGRRLELKSLWKKLLDFAIPYGFKPGNVAYVGQRKIGKTALLKRFLNIVFNEQDEVVPLYYEFSCSLESDEVEIANNIVVTWLKQWLTFEYKDLDFLEPKNINHLKEKMQEKGIEEKKKKKILDIWRFYQEGLAFGQQRGMQSAIMYAFQVVESLTLAFKKKCVVVIDEIQELESGNIKKKNGEEVHSKDSILEVAHGKNGIWVIISGSDVSILAYNILSGQVANRVFKENIRPLLEEEAKELIQIILKHSNVNYYPEIIDDIYKLVGGNPFYITTLLNQNSEYSKDLGKEKNFETKEALQEIYRFEVLDSNGKINIFWKTHFAENADKLNNDPENRKGLTFKILKYLAEEAEKHANKPSHEMPNVFELAKMFKMKEEDMKLKLIQLSKASFITLSWNDVVMVQDAVLSIIITQMLYANKKNRNLEIQKAIYKRLAQKVDSFKKNVKKVKSAPLNLLEIEYKKGESPVAKQKKASKAKTNDSLVAGKTKGKKVAAKTNGKKVAGKTKAKIEASDVKDKAGDSLVCNIEKKAVDSLVAEKKEAISQKANKKKAEKDTSQKKVSKIEKKEKDTDVDEVLELIKEVEHSQGLLNLFKGDLLEEKAREWIKEGIALPKEYVVDGDVHDISFKYEDKKYQVDAYGLLKYKDKKKGKKEKIGVMAEVKNVQSKISLPTVKKIVERRDCLKRYYHLDKLVSLIFVTNGLSKNAHQYLLDNGFHVIQVK